MLSTLTADTIRAMTLEEFLAHCGSSGRRPSEVLAEAGL